ncbi:MAG: SLBB domain-containing protein [Bacteroidota bacterium]
MTNLRTLFLFVLLLISLNVSAQSLSPEYIRNVKVNDLSNSDIVKIKNELDKQNMSFDTFETLAITNGMSPTDFSILKTRLQNLTPEINTSVVDKGSVNSSKPIELDERNSGYVKNISSSIFGSEIFTNSAMNFEPNSNLVTPANYILGPSDEIQLVVYGMQEMTTSLVVSKEGKVTIPVVGQVYVNGLTFEAAKTQIKKACSRVYSTISSGQSNVSMSLSKIKTIRITIIGAKKSGNFSVSSLSTVFNALHIAGGPEGNGSYRNIELIRNNKIIKKIDIYKFITSGDQSDNINLQENDLIRIPVYENRVKVEGKVKVAGVFELLPNETFLDLLKYCSGFDEAAYKANIKLIHNTEKELKIVDLSEAEYKNYIPKSGDVFTISSILNRFENKVSIKGAIFRPDDYALVEGMTLKDLIVKADGLKEDAFKNRALLIREMDDLTQEIKDVDLNKILNGSDNLLLRKNDEIIISSIFDMKVKHNVSIFGQIKKPGEFPYLEKLSLYDLIILAGGFTEGSSRVVEVSSIIVKDEKITDQKEYSTITTVEIDTALIDQSKNVFLKPFDVVQIRKKPVYETQKSVLILGEVLFPGNYTIINKNERVLDVINRAGGLKINANVEAVYVLRKIDRITTEKIEKQEQKIPIDLKRISKNPLLSQNIVLNPGDEIVVKKLDETVKVFGSVYLSTEIPYNNGKNLKYYIKSVGGFSETANKSKVYVINSNGLAKTTKRFLGIKKYPKIKRGCEIIVPNESLVVKNPNKMSVTEIATISGVFASIGGMTVAIINLFKQ